MSCCKLKGDYIRAQHAKMKFCFNMSKILLKQMELCTFSQILCPYLFVSECSHKIFSDRHKTLDKINGSLVSINWSCFTDFCRAATICVNSGSALNSHIFRNTVFLQFQVKARKARVALHFSGENLEGLLLSLSTCAEKV